MGRERFSGGDYLKLFNDCCFHLRRLIWSASTCSPRIWGKTDAERWGALDEATTQLNEQLGKNALMTGSQLALQKRDAAHTTLKAKCPFTPQREMVLNLWGQNLT
jgi:hypothetical protein